MRNGFLIGLEGIDGSGKSTQAKNLAKLLRASGYVVTETKEPTNGPWGQKIRESKANGRMSPSDEWAAFIADREEHVRDVIDTALERGHVVITDRYYYSMAAYQALRCGMTPKKAIEVNESFAPRPDLVVVMNVPVEVALERVGKREGGADSFEFEGSLRAAAQVFDGLRGEHIMHVHADEHSIPARVSIQIANRARDMLNQRERIACQFKPMLQSKSLADQVRDFQRMINRPEPEVPMVPDSHTTRLRIKLIAEEFFELLRDATGGGYNDLVRARGLVWDVIDDPEAINVDLPAFVDALADLDFVVEGTRQECGVDGAPIALAVYLANMAKLEGPVDPVTGKKLKPAGWVPPDIAGELVKQGWKG